MITERVTDWANKLYDTNGRIIRLNIVRIRPGDTCHFKKDIRNLIHVFPFIKGVPSTIFEGEIFNIKLENVTSVSKENDLDKIEKFIKSCDNTFDMTIVCGKDEVYECGIFLEEHRL